MGPPRTGGRKTTGGGGGRGSRGKRSKELAEFLRFHGAPLPAGLAQVQEAPLLSQTVSSKEELQPEFDYYESQKVTTQVLEVFNYNVLPIGALIHGQPIEFKYTAGTDQYADLFRSTLCVESQIVGPDDRPIADDAPVAPINNVLHSMFSQIEVVLGTTTVTQPTTYYPFIAYLAQLSSFEPAVLKRLKVTEGWYPDTAGKMDLAGADNEGWRDRRARYARSQVVPLEGRPFSPIFMQEGSIKGNLPIIIRLYPSRDAFVLHSANGDNTEYKMRIKSAFFRFTVKRVSPTLLKTHTDSIHREPFRLKYTDIWPKSHVISSGSANFAINNIFDGTLPDRLTMVMVDSEQLNGTYHTNPFHLQHYDARSVQIEVNGSMNPAQVIETNFSSDPRNTTNAYLQQMRELNIAFGNSAPAISPDEWATGFTFYHFNVLPMPETEDAKAPSKQGTILVRMILRSPTTRTVMMLLVSEFFGHWIEINEWNEVTA